MKRLRRLAVAAVAGAAALCAFPSRAAEWKTITSSEAALLGGATASAIGIGSTHEIRRIDNGDSTIDLVYICKSDTNDLVFADIGRIVPNSMRVLVVGGGGGGSYNCGGGGGAGGLIELDSMSASVGSYRAVVGRGGVGGDSTTLTGAKGMDSLFEGMGATYTAKGGGNGGNYGAKNGGEGGSGGGACGGGAPGATKQGELGYGLGYAGGRGTGGDIGGGGGGAGGPGKQGVGAARGGDGGDGVMSDISGAELWYAGGGAGAAAAGMSETSYGGSGVGGNSTTTGSTAGAVNTGSGGGGGQGGGGLQKAGGAGGSGVVIIRYTVRTFYVDGVEITGVGAEFEQQGNEVVVKFLKTDTENQLVLPKAMRTRVLAVGGGGAGANPGAATTLQGGAGGGGAGGFVEKAALMMKKGTYDITVGAGGVSPSAQGAGGNGGDSFIKLGATELSALRAYGGGGGGIKGAGMSGGSGGGGSKASGGAGTEGQGYAGGTGTANRVGAGGGGAGGIGGDATAITQGGNGGVGKESDITGLAMFYAGGGGGGSRDGTGGLGGSAKGGAGGGASAEAGSGENGTGSGGGGGSLNKKGGNGGSGVVIIRIMNVQPDKPTPTTATFEYTGEEQVMVYGYKSYVITNTTSMPWVEVPNAAATEVGRYTFTVYPKVDEGWGWSDDTTSPVNLTLNISGATLSVKDFFLNGWQEGAPASEPELVVTNKAGMVVQLKEGEFEYFWRFAGGAAEKSWSEEKPSAIGDYVIRAHITAEGFTDPDPECDFSIWAYTPPIGEEFKIDYQLGYHSDIEIGEGTNMVRVVVRRGQPAGFDYRYVTPEGDDIRFTDHKGEVLPMWRESWTPGGDSVFVVRPPADGSGIIMWWGLLVGVEVSDLEDGGEGIGSGDPERAPEPSGFGPAMHREDAVFRNRWVKDPGLTAYEWPTGTAAPEIIAGEPAYGTDFDWELSLSDGTSLGKVFPTEPGSYFIRFTSAAGSSGNLNWAGIETLKRFVISASSPKSDLSGTAGSQTLSGRVLLVNDDEGVTGQAYDDWEHLNEEEVPLRATRNPNIKPGNSHRLKVDEAAAIEELCGATTIWTLNDVYIGNTYASGVTDNNERNLLPSSASTAPTPADAAHLILRNMQTAMVCSPCYTNGIGTIYFDAVNGWTVDADTGYGVVVEMVTGADAMKDLKDIGSDEWRPVAMTPLKRDIASGSGFVKKADTEDLALDITYGKSDNQSFYRVITRVECHEPARFRIRRSSIAGSYTSEEVGGFILIDNVIVSYPAMRADLSILGNYDETRSGKQTIGCAGAWSVPFPAVGESLKPRAKVEFYTNPGDTKADVNKFITAATVHYRWRYLNQKIGDWQEVPLVPSTDILEALNPEAMPKEEGDIEFFMETRLNAPFYQYVDYSGTRLFLGNNLYTEEYLSITNRLSDYEDWFIRLRDGKSEYEGISVVVCESDPANDPEAVTNAVVVPMEVFASNTWRGYLRTPTNALSDVWFQLRGENKQVAGATEWVTNLTYWVAGESNSVPASTTAEVGGEESWTRIPRDGVTGYLMFQFDDSTYSLTLVHADYQNFKMWDDSADLVFVGTSEEPSGKKGVASEKRTYTKPFDNWKDMPITRPLLTDEDSDKLWKAPDPNWGDIKSLGLGREAYKWFETDESGAWMVGNGQWVSKLYRDDTSGAGVGLQISGPDGRGSGAGYLQLVTDKADSPLGIDTIKFNARVAQSIGWQDISYYMAEQISALSNYCFTARVAFDESNNKGFAGNASVSLVANYHPSYGCYEFRLEQYKANNEKDGVANNSQILSLYRWRNNRSELLGSVISTKGNIPTKGKDADPNEYIPMFISITNEANSVLITCGVRDGNNGILPSADFPSGESFTTIWFRDKSDLRLVRGTYGMVSANCPGVFIRPTCYEHPCVCDDPPSDSDIDDGIGVLSTKNYYTKTIKFVPPIVDLSEKTKAGGYDNCWYVSPERMATFYKSASEWGLKGKDDVTQTLKIYTAPAGKSSWTLVKSVPVSGFGSPSEAGAQTVPLYTTDACSVRIAVSSDTAPSPDVVIDNLSMTQFAGASWDDLGERYIPGWQKSTSDYGLTNFTFTAGMITNKSVLLSAKRTPYSGVMGGAGRQPLPAAIRSPLMDGDGRYSYSKRGLGLGMFSFAYENAHTNVNLLLQISTNITSSTITEYDSGSLCWDGWHTVTNFSFNGLSAAERASGVRSCYIGMHGVAGAMRLVMDPNVVYSVTNKQSRLEFGDIYITKVTCRDEPNLDDLSWWGWNLRTVGPDLENHDFEDRMFLFDMDRSREESGKSLALNYSTTNNIDKTFADDYKEHEPFIQTPTFATNVVGEISFRARRWLYTEEETKAAEELNRRPAIVTLYGATSGFSSTADWKPLKTFTVRSDVYTPFRFKVDNTDTYAAFRLAVHKVPEIRDEMTEDPDYKWDDVEPVRILLDEILVTEAIQPRVGFRNLGAFRCRPGSGNSMYDRKIVTDVPSEDEQPLVGEEWGVQCEIYKAMLPDEIYLNTEDPNPRYRPTVRLYWFKGKSPWGFENWRTNANAKSATLALATDATPSNLVFRSTTNPSPIGVIDQSTKPECVQYMLETVYYRADPTTGQRLGLTPVTNRMSRADFNLSFPKWYNPVDYNDDYATRGGGFAAFCLLDQIAPGWAWINEVNVFGVYRSGNTDKDYQYIEIAAPVEADISGWSVNLLFPKLSINDDLSINYADSYIITNKLATFGSGTLGGKKTGNMNQASNMVFRVLASQQTLDGGKVSVADGSLDGIWAVDNPTTEFSQMGVINYMYPFAIQLVRKSGVVEHELVSLGTNRWTKSSELTQAMYDVTNIVTYLNRALPKSGFFFAGNDDGAEKTSRGVFTASGSVIDEWNNTMTNTPGRINGGQYINPVHPTPNGTSMYVYCNLDRDSGPIYQTVGEAVHTNLDIVVTIPKGSETNIAYFVDKWYVVGEVTTNGVPIALSGNIATIGGKAYSNNITVVASAKVNPALEEAGMRPEYKEAIIDWLTKGVTLNPDGTTRPFANPDSDEIYFVQQREYATHKDSGKRLDLTEMYWLDMDPTVKSPDPAAAATDSGIWFEFMITNYNYQKFVPEYKNYYNLSNYLFSVYAMISNTVTAEAWAPYVTRSRETNMTSWDYRDGKMGSVNWTSGSMKPVIKVKEDSGLIGAGDPENWIAGRWFVFDQNSFRKKGDPAGEFTAEVEMLDPKSPISPAWWQGVKDRPDLDFSKHGFFRMRIDDMTLPYSVELLKTNSTYKTTTP